MTKASWAPAGWSWYSNVLLFVSELTASQWGINILSAIRIETRYLIWIQVCQMVVHSCCN